MTADHIPGYSRETPERAGATHINDGVAFSYSVELELAAWVSDPKRRKYPTAFGANPSPQQVARQQDRAVIANFTKQAKAMLMEAQAWVDDPNNEAKFGAPNLLRYAAPLGPDGQREWRQPYDVLFSDGDVSYQWPSPSGTGYVLIARDGRVIAAVRDYLLNEGRWDSE